MRLGGSRGFSLIEIVVVMMSVVALAALLLSGLAGQKERATSEGMARVLLAELESARVKALKTGNPVAFCFPSDDGATPETQSFYLMEGEVTPRVTRSRTLTGDFPKSSVVNAYWGAGQLATSAADVKRANLMAAWLGQQAGKDYALIFLPDGTVASNDVPQTNGSYRLMVASGATVSGAPLAGTRFNPSPNLFRLTGAFAPQTIEVSTSGQIKLTSGIVDAGGVLLLPGSPASGTARASLSVAAEAVDSLPQIATVAVAPKPFLEPKATVQKERNLSLSVTASDADGDQLFCSWRAEPQSGSAGTGSFSLGQDHPMLWDRKTNKWVSNCTWAPPSQCNVGDKYALICTITDADGNQAVAEEEVLDPVTIIPPGKVVVFNNYAPAPDLFTLSSDGTDQRSLTSTGYIGGISPDGSKIAWANEEASRRLWVMNVDGTGQKQLTTLGNNSSVLWSGDGRYILAGLYNEIRAVRADGSQTTTLYSSPDIWGSPQFTPDSELLVMGVKQNGTGGLPSCSRLAVARFDDSGSAPALTDISVVTDDTEPYFRHTFVTWIPGVSRQFLYTRHTRGPDGSTFPGGTWETIRARLVDTGAAGSSRFRIDQLAVTPGQEFLVNGLYAKEPVFSPDGSQVAYAKSSGGVFVADWQDLGNASLNTTNEKLIAPHTRGSWTVRAWIP